MRSYLDVSFLSDSENMYIPAVNQRSCTEPRPLKLHYNRARPLPPRVCMCNLRVLIARAGRKSSSSDVINPRRACAARVTVVGLCVCLSVCLFVCLFVCLSVDDYSRTTRYEAAYERYQQLQCYKGMKINVAILLKRLRSRDMA